MSNNFFDFINLHNGEEKREKVLETIKSNISFRGSNLWILACAIVIASVGLNVNSTAVIIGAMLISPLMGPIVGTGFALAIYDFELLKKSGINLLIATIVSLLVATIYFFVSPFKETQSELLARTSPNIYDVLIAFFGGLVGVIALTRVEKGNPIPGVAIATALMPPLCTAGYGLAIGNFSYFFGAFYLYSINCVFICISTFLIVKYLKYEPVNNLNTKFEKQIRYGITSLIFVMIIPSFYLAFNLFQEKKFSQNVEQFISKEFSSNGYALIYKDISYTTNPKKIELAFLTKKFTTQELDILNQKLLQYDITNTKLNIRQDTKDIKGEILDELGKQDKILSDKDILINNLHNELNKYKFNNPETIKEITILFPELKNISIGRHISNVNTDSCKTEIVLLYQTDDKIKKFDTEKLQQWLSQKLKTTDIKIVRQQ
ncbi:TIGR00341 family protein [Vaginella massiliensis]|uniref:TIGR00341 family protein n=1 Tax=Vaginella massiliensis TaxID=1816680 RepID=UPI0008397EF3|nr:TIGR00341 family protein [Vaginella massiliensis]